MTVMKKLNHSGEKLFQSLTIDPHMKTCNVEIQIKCRLTRLTTQKVFRLIQFQSSEQIIENFKASLEK